MPTSDFSLIPTILWVMRQLRPQSICDIGIGCGKYGLLFREALDLTLDSEESSSPYLGKLRLDGVEVYPQYIGPIQEAIYDKIYIGDICALADEMPEYDLFTMIDVIEHLDIPTGMTLLETLRSKSNLGVLVVTPVDPCEQGTLSGNEREAHISAWGKKEWEQLGRTRWTITRGKYISLVEGIQSNDATWLRKPRWRRRFRLALHAALDTLFPSRRYTVEF